MKQQSYHVCQAPCLNERISEAVMASEVKFSLYLNIPESPSGIRKEIFTCFLKTWTAEKYVRFIHYMYKMWVDACLHVML